MLGIVVWLPVVALAGSGDSPRRGGLFAPADGDGDGVPDRRDDCRVAPETFNGYADDDGCPDHLAVLDVFPMIGETAVAGDVVIVRENGAADELEAPRVADDLVPGERILLEVLNDCFYGQTEHVVGQGRNVVDVDLEPRLDNPLEWTVSAADGSPLREVVLRFDSTCAPLAPQRLVGGTGTVNVGDGIHAVTIESPGYESVTVAGDADDGSVAFELSPTDDGSSSDEDLPADGAPDADAPDEASAALDLVP